MVGTFNLYYCQTKFHDNLDFIMLILYNDHINTDLSTGIIVSWMKATSLKTEKQRFVIYTCTVEPHLSGHLRSQTDCLDN